MWAEFPALADLLNYNGSGVMPGRTLVIAPDRGSLVQRWKALQSETDTEKKEILFHPHLQGDKHVNKSPQQGLYGHEFRPGPVASDMGAPIQPVRYGYRSFYRQWIITDGRLINRPNPNLWEIYSSEQVYMTALQAHALTTGPAVTFSAAIPDLHHYSGRGGRVFPLWADRKQEMPKFKAGFLLELSQTIGDTISAPDMMAYIAAVAAHPEYTARFQADLVQPGLRFPFTANKSLFAEAVEIGREIIWLHCFGERFADPSAKHPNGASRMPQGKHSAIPKDGANPRSTKVFHNRIEYDDTACRLKIGGGCIDNVQPVVWEYEISGKQVLVQWF